MKCKNCGKKIPASSWNKDLCSELCDIGMKASVMRESTNSTTHNEENKTGKNAMIWWIFVIGILYSIQYFYNNPRNLFWLIPIGWVILFLFLVTYRLFWIIILFFWWLAWCFSMLASIISFQILWAIWFFILMSICWWILLIIKDA